MSMNFQGNRGILLSTAAIVLLMMVSLAAMLAGPVNLSVQQINDSVKFVKGPGIILNLVVGIVVGYWGFQRVRRKHADRVGLALYAMGLATVLGLCSLVITLLKIRAL